jgi:predicted metal-dependent hydrolase
MFHWKLSQFPLNIVDYVVVHELAHLKHFNHSKIFWSLVEQYHPDYKLSKKRLKENGN